MKKKVIGLLVIVAIAVYVWLPYRAIGKFETAIRNGDKAAVQELVDFPALRESVKEAAKAKAMGAPDADRDVVGRIGEVLAGALVDKLVDEMVTPAGMEALLTLQGRKDKDQPVFREKRWTRWNEMTAAGDGGGLVVFRLAERGGWKVVGVREAERK